MLFFRSNIRSVSHTWHAMQKQIMIVLRLIHHQYGILVNLFIEDI